MIVLLLIMCVVLFAAIISSVVLSFYLLCRLWHIRPEEHEKILNGHVFWGWRYALYLANREYSGIPDANLIRWFERARVLQGIELALMFFSFVSLFAVEIVRNWDVFRVLFCPG